jgi:hypothetical protein
MDHLKIRGNGIDEPPHMIYYGDELSDCLDPGKGIRGECRDFVAFPRNHGQQLTSDYKLAPVSGLQQGSETHGDYDQQATEDGSSRQTTGDNEAYCGCLIAQRPTHRLNLLYFSQCWLFFHLLRCFFGTAKSFVPQPHSAFMELSEEQSFLGTASLPNYLKAWTEKIGRNHEEGPLGVSRRLVKLGHVLQLAKRFVTKNFGEKSEIYIPGQPELDLRKKEKKDKDLLGLVLMSLGETLWATLQNAIQTFGIQPLDWMMEEDEGWGPSPWTFAKMEEKKWCPRAQRIIKGQFGRNATLMCISICVNSQKHNYIHHDNHPNRPVKPCTATACHFVEVPFTTSDLTIDMSPENDQTHTDMCQQDKETQPDEGTTCAVIEAPEDTILDILDPRSAIPSPQGDVSTVSSSTGATDDAQFPLLRLTRTNGTIVVLAEPWTPTARYITISHVWSHGLGTRGRMALNDCQVRRLYRYLKRFGVHAGPMTKDEEESSCLFWLDTLAIPKTLRSMECQPWDVRETRRRTAGAKALSLIHKVYENAEHCIIIDRGLTSLDQPLSETIAMRLISSAWMSRLWTLQEAYASRSLSVVFDVGLDGNATGRLLDDLWKPKPQGKPDGKHLIRSLLLGMLKRSVDRNTMANIESDSLLISHAWRAAQYRVSTHAHSAPDSV